MGETSQSSNKMGDPEKRHRVRPLVVAGALVPDPSGGVEHEAFALILTLDVDLIPGFREIINRQRNGEEFDVISRWGVAMDKSDEHPPVALIDFYLPEFDLGIEIGIDVDEHPRSILGAIRSRRVLILDPDSYEQLQKAEEGGRFLESIRPFGLGPADSKPLIGVLQQRFDLPLDHYEPEWNEITEENREALASSVLEGARSVAGVGWSVRGDGPATIFLVDPTYARPRDDLPVDAKIEGRWGAMIGDLHAAVTFDAFADGHLLGRWLLLDPPDGMVQAGSNGVHFVAIVSSLDKNDHKATNAQMKDAVIAWVPHVEVLRRLRFERRATTE
jgi:hypothetical protein